MADHSQQADELRRRMEGVRTDLDHDVEGIVENAKTLADWKHYVRSFPCGSVAAAAALGYFAVPQKLQVLRPDFETLEKLADKNKLVVTSEPKAEAEKRGGIAAYALSLAGTLALKAAMNYFSAYMGKRFREQDVREEEGDLELRHRQPPPVSPPVSPPPTSPPPTSPPYGVPR